MAKTDSPLKQLVLMCIEDFATWLLGEEVQAVAPAPGELHRPLDPVQPDQVFQVTLARERTAVLHIEFQGPRS
ncbi:MAG: hypothetical protein HC884_15800, partial [Chloroflexaceae bacterium]|nr:hypothetical protein [Chloroflexaceae bacterium]